MDLNDVNSNQQAQNTTEQKNESKKTTQNELIDYAKIQEMIDGRNAKTEDSVLKSYFQKQGMTAEEMEKAISSFKTQKENSVNKQSKEYDDMKISLNATQEKMEKMIKENQNLKVQMKAYDLIDTLNVDTKSLPYIFKLIDFSNCVDKEGNIIEDTLKNTLEKVINDVPAFKKQAQGISGITVGADTSNNTNSNNNAFEFGFTGVRKK